MTWVLLVGGALVLATYLVRRRRKQFAVLRSDPMSTIHGGLSKKQSAKTRAALAAATESLR